MKQDIMWMLNEEIQTKDCCLVSYYLELPNDIDPYEKAKTMAVGQTIGTWMPVPGITDDMKRDHMGKVVNIIDLDTSDLSVYDSHDRKRYIFQIGYPIINFEDRLPLMLTMILGNDASTSVQAKVVDLQIPKSLADLYPGPAFGIEGIRELCGVKERPVILNMIKPCLGFAPKTGANIFYQTALGGIDFIKDDELLGNPDFCPLSERIKEYLNASRAAYEITGKETIYIPNITDHIVNLTENAKRAEEAGARMVMVNMSTVGFSALQMLREEISIPIMGHYAASGSYYENPYCGMSSDIVLGKLPRLAGADVVMFNSPYGGYPMKKVNYMKTANELTLPFYDKKPVLPSCGGGVNPGIVHTLVSDLGNDIMLAPGGAIQGHPMGAAAGVRAMMQAVEAEMKGITLEEALETSPELQAARFMWEKTQ